MDDTPSFDPCLFIHGFQHYKGAFKVQRRPLKSSNKQSDNRVATATVKQDFNKDTQNINKAKIIRRPLYKTNPKWANNGRNPIDKNKLLDRIDRNPRPVGRPADFKQGYCDIVYQYRLLGLAARRVAELLYITEDTLYEWLKVIPEFSEAWELGGDSADAKVINAMFQAATGFEHDSEQLFFDRSTGAVIRTPTKKKYKPDVAAGQLWLTNRTGRKKSITGEEESIAWRNKQNTEVTGLDGAPLPPTQIIIEGVEPTLDEIKEMNKLPPKE